MHSNFTTAGASNVQSRFLASCMYCTIFCFPQQANAKLLTSKFCLLQMPKQNGTVQWTRVQNSADVFHDITQIIMVVGTLFCYQYSHSATTVHQKWKSKLCIGCYLSYIKLLVVRVCVCVCVCMCVCVCVRVTEFILPLCHVSPSTNLKCFVGYKLYQCIASYI